MNHDSNRRLRWWMRWITFGITFETPSLIIVNSWWTTEPIDHKPIPKRDRVHQLLSARFLINFGIQIIKNQCQRKSTRESKQTRRAMIQHYDRIVCSYVSMLLSSLSLLLPLCLLFPLMRSHSASNGRCLFPLPVPVSLLWCHGCTLIRAATSP